MLFNRRLKSFFILFSAFLLIGQSYHCAIEDLIKGLPSSIHDHGDTNADFADDHEGGTHGHQDDSSQPHKHGEPHQTLALKVDNAAAALIGLFFALIPLLTFLVRISRQSNTFILAMKSPPHAPSEPFKALLASLSLAAQAPPLPL